MEQNISEGGLIHILEKMWVGLASIEVGSLPLRRGAWFESDMYTVAFVRPILDIYDVMHYLSLQSILDIYDVVHYL